MLQLSSRPVEMASSSHGDKEPPPEKVGEKRKRPLEEWLEDHSPQINGQDEEDAIKLMSIKLLSEKEKRVEAFMHNFLETFQKNMELNSDFQRICHTNKKLLKQKRK